MNINSHRWWVTALSVTLLACPSDDGNKEPVNSTFKITSPPSEVDFFEGAFEKYATVFGIHFFATESTPDGKILHALNILSQYMDNDEDGGADNSAVMEELQKVKASMVMFATQREAEQFFEDGPPRKAEEMWDRGELRVQDLYGEETIPPGTSDRFDATLEETLHLITSAGYASAYPDIFGESAGSTLAALMDSARGGYFEDVPMRGSFADGKAGGRYPERSWYHYTDTTCEYGCMVTEYIYWALTSILGAQSNLDRCSDISVEWELCTGELVASRDSGVFALLTDPKYHLPTVLPDGTYQDDR